MGKHLLVRLVALAVITAVAFATPHEARATVTTDCPGSCCICVPPTIDCGNEPQAMYCQRDCGSGTYPSQCAQGGSCGQPWTEIVCE